jgi:predicted nucleic acid-binding protein
MAPLLIVDTNILFDWFLDRDPLARNVDEKVANGALEVRLPEFVLHEFEGSMKNHLRLQKKEEQTLKAIVSSFGDSRAMSVTAGLLERATYSLTTDLAHFETRLPAFVEEIRQKYTVVPHTPDLHFQGDLRFVRGLPPDRPKRGIQDCRIFEGVLDIARTDAANVRKRFFLTKDSDFQKDDCRAELRAVGVELVKNLEKVLFAKP